MAQTGQAWFADKTAGLGMRPVAWQGWVLTVVLFAWIAAGLAAFARGFPEGDRFIVFGVWLAVAALLLFVMRRRTAPSA